MAVTHDRYAVAVTVVQHVVEQGRFPRAKETRQYRDRQRRLHDFLRLAHRVVRGLTRRSSHLFSHRWTLFARRCWGGTMTGRLLCSLLHHRYTWEEGG